jgi:hypothetical protein
MRTSRRYPTLKRQGGRGADGKRACDHPGCAQEGEYRAPRSREPSQGLYWFCLPHVREYNAAWNFFAGMKPDEIERYIRENVTGHRPTWRLGTKPSQTFPHFWVKDDLGLLGELGIAQSLSGAKSGARPRDPRELKALATLDLEPEVNLQQIKTRFKQLVKRYHPDANGGERRAEERLKAIIEAYSFLLTCGYG